MSYRDETPVRIPVNTLFGAALDASATWVGLARRGVVVSANRSLRDVLEDAGTGDLGRLLPCWKEHVDETTSIACPCPHLAESKTQPGAYCRSIPARYPGRIVTQDIDPTQSLRLIVIEPRRGQRSPEPAQHVAHALARVRAALEQVEHQLINELHTGSAMLRPPSLSPREWDVAQGLASGKRAPAVAASLGISVHTVRNHLKSVFRKLDVTTQAGLRRRLQAPPSSR